MKPSKSSVLVAGLLLTACTGSPQDADNGCASGGCIGPPSVSPVQGFTQETSSGEVRLSWSIPHGATQVMIRRSTQDNPEQPSEGVAIYDGSGTSVTDDDVRNFTEYFYSAFSYNDAGDFGPYPSTLRSMPSFEKVGELRTLAEPDEVTLTWELPSDAAGVMIRRGDEPSEDPKAGTEVYRGSETSFVDDSVKDHSVYYYRAFSIDDEGVVHPDAAVSAVRPPGWAKVSAGKAHSLAIAKDGTLWAWGANSHHQLGVETETCTDVRGDEFPCSNTPVQVGTESDWTEVAAAWYYSLALRSDGTLWTWGETWVGDLFRTPTQTGADTDWEQIAVGDDHSMGLKRDGSLWVWGNGGWGQIGNGATGSRANPTLIAESGPWIAMDADANACIALKDDGTIWVWGRNLGERFGDGTSVDLNFPVQVGSDDHWTSVGMGAGMSGLRDDGSVWTLDEPTPAQVGTSSDWDAIVVDSGHTLALRTDGTLWAWGYNFVGELGTGKRNDESDPVQIGSDTWLSVSTNSLHSLGVRSDGHLYGWGDNSFGQIAAPGLSSGVESPAPIY